MQLIRGLYNLRPEHQGSVATIGNFDGVHRGHHVVMQQLKDKATQWGYATTVISFEPLPQEYFGAENAPARLTPLREKLVLLKSLGIDQLLCLPFNRALAETTAEQFIERILVQGLGIRHLVVGDDFRFGKDRRGDFSMLQTTGEACGFGVSDTRTLVCNDDTRVSSTRIREALAAGKLQQAHQLLGRPFTMSGRVVHGDKRGRELGFPTANIPANKPVCPLHGVFAVSVEGAADHPVSGVCNVGTRPTFNASGFLIEVHLLDFSGDLYGKRLTINWLKKLRSEQRFDTFEDLVTQIHKDIADARHFFASEQNAA